MGGSKRAYAYSKYLSSEVVICYKQREKANKVSRMELIGNVKDKNVILVDDMVDTAGTLTKAAILMKDEELFQLEQYVLMLFFQETLMIKLKNLNLKS